MLKFLGRGSAFADEHNSAFFYHNKDLVLIDCPATSFQKIKKMKLNEVQKIYILITHTHGDHSGSVGTMLQFAWFVLNNPVTIVAPSETVKNDLMTLLIQIEGCEPDWFNITTADELHEEWLISAVPTIHAQTLDGKCFGYHLKVEGKEVVYTGDTATIAPFLPLLHSGTFLYSEIAFYKSNVHLHYIDTLPILKELSQNGVKVYLMHLDNEEEIAKIIENTDLNLAPLYQGE
jgi:ribonuclease BN (tRNA processing enzyme)